MKSNRINLIVAAIVVVGLRPLADAGAQQTDAISREFSVYNGALSPPVVYADAVSREFSVFNGTLSPPVPILDSVSREFTVYNGLLAPPIVLGDAVSREMSVKNIFLCKGNMTDDGLVTLADVPAFVSVLIGQINDLYLSQAADVNCDGAANGLDIQPFVNCMVGGPCP